MAGYATLYNVYYARKPPVLETITYKEVAENLFGGGELLDKTDKAKGEEDFEKLMKLMKDEVERRENLKNVQFKSWRAMIDLLRNSRSLFTCENIAEDRFCGFTSSTIRNSQLDTILIPTKKRTNLGYYSMLIRKGEERRKSEIEKESDN